mmetsp:Transcript_84834/g.181736  ORF Transcript_84834/g.181736 Transcript_84834/m.181736 type:complete len:81 (+) Transcript_84834:2-244(+)
MDKQKRTPCIATSTNRPPPSYEVDPLVPNRRIQCPVLVCKSRNGKTKKKIMSDPNAVHEPLKQLRVSLDRCSPIWKYGKK